MIIDLPMRLSDYEFKVDFYVVNMGDMDVVLGMTWIHAIEELTLNVKHMELRFEVNGRKHVLKAITDTSLQIISYRRMERLIHHDQLEWAAKYKIMPM